MRVLFKIILDMTSLDYNLYKVTPYSGLIPGHITRKRWPYMYIIYYPPWSVIWSP